jgi:hypothetical protein
MKSLDPGAAFAAEYTIRSSFLMTIRAFHDPTNPLPILIKILQIDR